MRLVQGEVSHSKTVRLTPECESDLYDILYISYNFSLTLMHGNI